MTRILASIIVIISLVAVWLYASNKSLKNSLTAAQGEIALKDEYIFSLEHSVREMSNTIATQAQAIEQAKDFEKELNDDTNVDNLDVVPANYILKQLRAD